ncbi:MAG: HAD-IA family hydrolase, partial [Hyphomicrobiales bacterium]|nr:HAD-IA family hydrolase [Hyphomicrobiales bacterium]
KHAVEGLSESLAFELKEFGIRVKIIEPGPIKTEFYGRGESRSQDAGRPWEEAETEAIDRYPDRAELIRAYRARWHEMVPGAIDGTVAILEELAAAETPLHAITNFAADTFAETRRRFGFFERFQSIVVSGEIGIVKPDARIFRHLAERQGFDLARAVLIDDSAANCAAARELGMGVVHFKEPGQARRELIEQGFPLRPAA